MAAKWKTGCLAKIEDDAEYAAVMVTVPKTKNPTTLAEFGYQFTEEGKLVQISNGKPFAWLGQKHYDKLGDALVGDIYTMLETRFNLKRVMVPLSAPNGTPQCPVFVSDNFGTADVSVILCQGSGAVRPGMWARALCINDSLATGTIFSYLEEIVARGWGVIVLNPNENGVSRGIKEPVHPSKKDAEETVEEYWLATPDAEWKKFTYKVMSTEEEIEANDCPQAHMLYIWDNFVSKAESPIIPIIAHSYGGKCTTALVRERLEQVQARVPAVVLTDAINDVSPYKDEKTVIDFMKKRTVNWVASHEKLDTPCPSRTRCTEVSSGHPKHEWTSSSCLTSAFKYLDAQVSNAMKQPQQK